MEPSASDGCTGSFDVWRRIDIRSCCEAHDLAWYERPGDWLAWAGSTVDLAGCFWQAGQPEIAILGFAADSTVGAFLFTGIVKRRSGPKPVPRGE